VRKYETSPLAEWQKKERPVSLVHTAPLVIGNTQTALENNPRASASHFMKFYDTLLSPGGNGKNHAAPNELTLLPRVVLIAHADFLAA
jgi:hypothetical protein